MKKIGKIILHQKFKEFYEQVWDCEDKNFLILDIAELKLKYPCMSESEIIKRHDEIIREFKRNFKKYAYS